jgi:hypothetical protein
MHTIPIQLHPNPKLYSIGDIVFACHAVRSDASRGQVDKLAYTFTGPWRITAKLHGTSYKVEHCASKSKYKWHALDLSPYPAKLISLHLLDGADNQYGQIHKHISENLFIQAGIKGFVPPLPFNVPAQYMTANQCLGFQWPTLTELNKELFPYPWSHNKEFSEYLSKETGPHSQRL